MKIVIAKTAGFCMGVRRAVEMVLDGPGREKEPIFTFGPLIHNPQVLGILEEKGIAAIQGIPEKGCGTVFIRAHGVPPFVKEDLQKSGFHVIDATCPRVIRVQTIIRKHAEKGFEIIIIGDEDHPEVVGLLGYAGKRGHVAANVQDLEALPPFEKAIIVAQTTQNTTLYEEVKRWAERRYPRYLIFHTICDSTLKRQDEVMRMAQEVDAVIVVGGKNSGNTKRLAEIGKEAGKPTFHIESESEIDRKKLAGVRSVGITAGASTPNWVIRKIQRTLENLPFEGGNPVFRNIQKTLLLTNTYVSLGAGCLSYASCKLQEIPNAIPYVLISVFYVQSMHILNNLTGRDADHYNDPERAAFYSRNIRHLTSLALISGGIGLLIAAFMGKAAFLLLLCISLLGLSYNITILPNISGLKYRRIRDIPGSKTILIAMAWAVVSAVFPGFSKPGGFDIAFFIAFTWSICMVFVRTAFFDCLDMQGDRIVGRETIPILLGEKKTRVLLKTIIISVFFLLFVSSGFGFIPSLGYLMALCSAYMFGIFNAFEKKRIQQGVRVESAIENHFIFSGILTFFWSTF